MMNSLTGKGGSGKTKGAARVLKEYLLSGDTKCFSNLPVKAPLAIDDGRLSYYSDLYDLARQVSVVIRDMEESDRQGRKPAWEAIFILLDEAPNFINARNWKDLSVYFQWLTGQDRHFGCDLLATGRAWRKIDVDFRQQCRSNYVCSVASIIGIPLAINMSRKQQKKGKIPRGLFRTIEYDADEFETWHETQYNPDRKPKPTYGAHFWQGWSLLRKSDRDFFNTFAIIPFPYEVCFTCGHVMQHLCENKRCKEKVPYRVAAMPPHQSEATLPLPE